MPDEKLRLFTAVQVPHARLEWLDGAVSGLKAIPGARWTPLGDRHVTLNFLGWVEAAHLPAVTSALDGVSGRHTASAVSLGELGAFPNERRARVLWAGIHDEGDLLPSLSRDLGDALETVGYEPESRPFVAHLTLARFKTPRSLAGTLPGLEEPPAPFVVDRVALYRSRLGPSGARYEVVHEAYLTPVPRGQSGSQ